MKCKSHNKFLVALATLCFLSSFLLACKTMSTAHNQQSITTYQVLPGTIGDHLDALLEKRYTNLALPKYQKPIAMLAITSEFNDHSFKAYLEANNRQSKNLNITYNDSTEVLPRYVNLRIADKVEVLNELNAAHNRDIKEYLATQQNAQMIISISLALEPKDINAITTANRILLVNKGAKHYGLQLFHSGKMTAMDFGQGVIFGFSTANFCWQQDEKYQLQIVDMKEGKDRCPRATYDSARRAEKEIDYFKF